MVKTRVKRREVENEEKKSSQKRLEKYAFKFGKNWRRIDFKFPLFLVVVSGIAEVFIT